MTGRRTAHHRRNGLQLFRNPLGGHRRSLRCVVRYRAARRGYVVLSTYTLFADTVVGQELMGRKLVALLCPPARLKERWPQGLQLRLDSSAAFNKAGGARAWIDTPQPTRSKESEKG